MDLFMKRTFSGEWAKVKRKSADALHRMGVPLDSNDLKLLKFKNCHAGKRAFILGNGPSLKVADIDRLKNEITFASNKIYLAFDQTQWRPTYFFVADRLVARNNTEVIKKLPLTKIMSDEVKEYFADSTDVIWFHELLCNSMWTKEMGEKKESVGGIFSTNALWGAAAGWTVIYLQLQLAYYMGISEVYLMGVDFSFSVPETKVSTEIKGYEVALKSQGEVNHFHPDYRKPGEVWAIPNMEMQLCAFRLARQVFDAAGRKLYNASRVSKLTVLERVDFDSIMPKV
jgi:hypothetical protein